MWFPLKSGTKATNFSEEVVSQWTILHTDVSIESMDKFPAALSWAKENTEKEVYATIHFGVYHIGFESVSDSLIFKMNFPHYRKTNE
jgi:glutathionyl-hydroquinone reductase